MSKKVQNSIAFSLINQLWNGLPFVTEEYASRFPSNYKEGFLLQEIMTTSLALSLRLLVQKTSSLSPFLFRPVRRPSHTRTVAAGTPSVASYHSISPSPSNLCVPNSLFTQQQQLFSFERSDYQMLVESATYNHLVLLRESLLPIYNSSNILIASQLKRNCHNSRKLSVEYELQLRETTVVVTNGVGILKGSYDSQPELMVGQLHVSGYLEYTVESRTVSSKAANYIVTVRHKQRDTDLPQKLRSNVMSKCSVSLETLAIHVTLPLLVVIRHTSESLRHMVKSLQDFKITLPHFLVDENPIIDQMNQSISFVAWTRVQQLKQLLIDFENKHLPMRSSQSTPHSGHNLTNRQPVDCANISLQGDLSECNPSLSSVTSEHPDSPLTDGVPACDHPIFSSSSHGVDPIEDTTDSPNVFSSDPDAPIQSSMATYDTSKSTLKMSSVNNIDEECSELPEMPNVREILLIPDDQLEFSVYGSVKVTHIHLSTCIESLHLLMEVNEISASVDCRKIPLLSSAQPPRHIPFVYKLLPSYLSVASTLKQTAIRTIDHAISTR